MFYIEETHHSQPPRITRRINRVTFQAGNRATVACIAQGYPVPNYRWRRHLADEMTVSGIGSSIRQESGILTFEKVSVLNSGKYTCYVSNTMGDDKMDVEIVVEGKKLMFHDINFFIYYII